MKKTDMEKQIEDAHLKIEVEGKLSEQMQEVFDAHNRAISKLSAEVDRLVERNRRLESFIRSVPMHIKHATHTCMSEKHCDFLHASHDRVATELEKMAIEVLKLSEATSP